MGALGGWEHWEGGSIGRVGALGGWEHWGVGALGGGGGGGGGGGRGGWEHGVRCGEGWVGVWGGRGGGVGRGGVGGSMGWGVGRGGMGGEWGGMECVLFDIKGWRWVQSQQHWSVTEKHNRNPVLISEPVPLCVCNVQVCASVCVMCKCVCNVQVCMYAVPLPIYTHTHNTSPNH